MDEREGLSSETPQSGKRFELKRWNAVALWMWNTEVEDCTICRNSLMDPCINCESKKGPPTECNVAWGECNHAFHHHCIEKWLKTRHVCPLDNKEWRYQKFGA